MEIRTGRREMMTSTLIALPAGLFLVSCSSSSSDGGDDPAAPPTKSGSIVVYTSSMVQSHSHTFGVEASALATPPTDGVSGSTSADGGHTHSVSVTAQQLQSVSAGQSVKVTTTSTGGHTHVFTFVKVG